MVFRHGLQLFGAMGFTWENDLQFALKRAKAGELLLGGAAEHRALIAAEKEFQMQLTFDSDVEEFRAEFAAFLDEHLPSEAVTQERPRSVSHMPQWARDWQRLLFDNGWLLPRNRRSSVAATRPCCSSSCTSTSCAGAGSTTASTRRA